MPIPITLVLFIIVIIVIKIKMGKADKAVKDTKKNFWDREEKAMFVRKKSLEHLDYIHINPKRLPITSMEECSEDLLTIQNKILELAQLKMVNFNGKTNTDLKLEFGTANFDKLAMYDDHYNMMIKTLYKWAKLLYEEDRLEDAIRVLEVGVDIKTDISDHYILLGKLYKKKKDTDSFESLYVAINETEFLLKDKVLNTLDSLR